MNRGPILVLCAAVLVLGACGGRRANPVGTISVTDQQMSCTEIQASVIENDARMAALREEERRAKSGNVAIGVVGAILFWPALFALDTTNTEQVEITALQNRNAWLASLAAQRRCGPGGAEPAREPQRDAGDRAPAGRTPAAAPGGEFRRCQLDNGSLAMLTARECTTWGGRLI
jgi:hypothetical protein